MWTPKRILILIGGLIFFLIGFAVYAYFLGGIDGLPPLPAGSEWTGSDQELEAIPPETGSDSDNKLRMAFNAECEELRRTIKMDLRSKGWVFAANQFDIDEKDGRVKLTPFSACIFAKQRPDLKFHEITTVQCETAYLTLDKPVTNHAELSNRKVIAVELRGGHGRDIVIRNNRGTPELNDDIEVRVITQPLFYEEKKSLIWTDGPVELGDFQTRPATRIEGHGLELYLSKESAAAKNDKNKRGKSDPVSGVDRIVLRSSVHMHLTVDANSGFLGDNGGRKKVEPIGPVAKQQPEKAQIHIQTPGRFTYDLVSEKAVFETPPPPAKSADPLSPQQIVVNREHPHADGVLVDQLVCDYLEMYFRKKVEVAAPSPLRESRTSDKEIDRAYAKSGPGGEVRLVMDTENIDAQGAEMIYHAPTDTAGARTILKGNPLHAAKEAHELVALELTLIGADKNNKGQRAEAIGPGRIDLFDKSKSAYPLHATWKDKLVSTKVKEGDQLYDFLVLTVEASFVDDEHKQELHADRIEVLLQPTNPDDGTKQSAPGAPRQKPQKVDAFGNVHAFSPDFVVKRAEVFQVRFKDMLPSDERLPQALPPVVSRMKPPDAGPAPNWNNGTLPTPPGFGVGPPGVAPPGVDANNPAAAPKTKPPIELEARHVLATIKRGGSKDELHKLICEDGVHVHQEPEKADDKGIDIKGNLLELTHHVDGDILCVFGDVKKPAELQLGELYMTGPTVTINQQRNTAEIAGNGAMSMPSKTNLDGSASGKKDTRLEVYWNKDMVFDGQFARFHGGVMARQENAGLRCQNLQVKLDRVVSLKEGQKNGQNAKVDTMVCELKVSVVEEIRDRQGSYLKYNALTGTCMTLDNQEETSNAHGPGEIFMLSQSNGDAGPLGPSPAPAAKQGAGPKTEVMKLTHIYYDGRVFNNNKDKISHIYDNVRVLHFPANDPNATMNPDRPPKDGFYLKCEKLTTYTRELAPGRVSRNLHAQDRVEFNTDTFYGKADSVKWDENSDQVIFEGIGAPATLYKIVAAGAERQTIRAKRILYNRKTGLFQVDGATIIQSRLERPRSLAVARLDANRQDQPFARLALTARDDG